MNKTGQKNKGCLYWFIAAETVSQFGNGFNQLALIYLFLEVGNSPTTMGIVVGISSAVKLLFRYFAGILLDRGPRKTIIVIAEYASSIASFSFIILKMTNLLNIYSIIVCTVAYSITSVFFDTSVKLILRSIVGKRHLLKANSLYTTLEQIALSVSPFIAGTFIAVFGSLPGMFIDGITSIFAATVTFALPIISHSKEPCCENDTAHKNVIISFYSKNNDLIWILIGVLITNISLSSLEIVLPIFSNVDLCASSFGVGIMTSAISVGMMTGSFLIGKFDKEKPKERYFVLCIGIAIIGLTLMSIGMIPHLLFSVVSFFIIGCVIGSTGVITATLWQQKIPNDIRGRVFSFNKLVNHVADPLSLFFFSSLLGNISNRFIFLLLGVINIISALILTKSKKAFTVDHTAAKAVNNVMND